VLSADCSVLDVDDTWLVVSDTDCVALPSAAHPAVASARPPATETTEVTHRTAMRTPLRVASFGTFSTGLRLFRR
jgi:hypothetical protein